MLVHSRLIDIHLKHPDKQQHQTDVSAQTLEQRFLLIQEAYQLLGDANKRSLYLRAGIGWRTPNMMSEVPFDQQHNPWGKPRHRPRSAHERPQYPSGQSDWHREYGTGFYDTSYQAQAGNWNKASNRKLMTVLSRF